MSCLPRLQKRLLAAAALVGSLSIACDGASTDPGPLTHPVGTSSGRLGIEGSPWSITVSSKGEAWVTLLDKNEIARFSTANPTGLGSPFIFAVHPMHVAFNRIGTIALVGGWDPDRRVVYSVNAASGEATFAREMSGRPYRVALARDESRLFVLSYGDPAQVYSYPLTGLIGAQGFVIQVPGIARAIAVSPTTGEVIVTTSARVARLDPATLETKAMIGPVSIVSQDVVITPDGARLWMGSGAGSLVALDATSLAQVAEIPLGTGIFGLAQSPDATQLWATTPTGELLVVDPVGASIVTRLTLGGIPNHIAFDPSGTTAFVANEAGWVDVIR